MSINLVNNFVSVSEFSQGKANKIFNDVAENHQEYLVMKNNKPTAVVISVEEYQKMTDQIKRLEAYAELIERKK
ncbi:MAG: type II toxin-antitoxin system Phd/YefM family antitoxin [Eubacterium sp.]|nr:type II toxin-antitoxin system Phd/YefM family antitoxin [Eubacterium sp.]